MTFDHYQNNAATTALGLATGPHSLVYNALGLVGEAGEVAEKVKKFWRNLDVTDGRLLAPLEYEPLLEEMGDVLWYLSALASCLDVPLSSVAKHNIEKLQDRQRRGVLASQGDTR